MWRPTTVSLYHAVAAEETVSEETERGGCHRAVSAALEMAAIGGGTPVSEHECEAFGAQHATLPPSAVCVHIL